MDESSPPDSPVTVLGGSTSTMASSTVLQPAAQSRINHKRGDSASSLLLSSVRGGTDGARDSSVHEKISQFNTLAMQSKQLERKTADAALKRAMLGREEAEAEMRRYRDEARLLRKQADEGKERERKVGERLETVMENYGRAKETHAHTQALWEKEIRRARKETFKSQSVIVKLQEELKSARTLQKTAEESLEREKERRKEREQEAFAARYSLVGLQEQLDQALERIKVVEQERDAFKTLAKNEEDVARIAAEGKLPLPPSESGPDEDDEFDSPKKKARVSSVNIADVKSSAASEAEIEELTRMWQWERQRANRAQEHVEFLQAECHLKCCPCAKAHSKSSLIGAASARRKRPEPVKIMDAGDRAIISDKAPTYSVEATKSLHSRNKSKTELLREEEEPRRSTIFIPQEGVFRTVSQQEAEALEALEAAQAVPEAEPAAEEHASEPPTPIEATHNPRMYARTPSVDPPAFALLMQERTSLLSLLEAPHQRELQEAPLTFNIPTTPGPLPTETLQDVKLEPEDDEQLPSADASPERSDCDATITQTTATDSEVAADPLEEEDFGLGFTRPHTAAAFYTTKTTTTKVPLREETDDPNLAQRIMAVQRTPSHRSNSSNSNSNSSTAAEQQPSFDVNNPALTPTMTREQALAQIRERRGRARSVAQGTATPRKQMVQGVGLAERRDVSAPAGRRVVSGGKPGRAVRT